MSLQQVKEQALQLGTTERLELVRAIVKSLQDPPQIENWQFLVSRPHPWRKQLYIKGRKLLAATLWQDMIANHMTPEQAAENWDLPLAAIQEATHYCEFHQDLLKIEAEEERYRLEEREVFLGPSSAA